jgi:hypothetical protein
MRLQVQSEHLRNLAPPLPKDHAQLLVGGFVKKALLLLVLVTLPGILWAKDGPGSAGKLETACKVWTSWGAAGRQQPKVLTPDSARTTVAQASCILYLQGWYAGVDGALAPDDKGVMGVATFSDGVTTEQMAKVFVLYMAAHPEAESKLAHVAVSDAMFNAGLLAWPAYKAGQ